jgi:hypothetical protein
VSAPGVYEAELADVWLEDGFADAPEPDAASAFEYAAEPVELALAELTESADIGAACDLELLGAGELE